MPPHARKLILLIHVTASAGWAGVEACLLVLCLSGLHAGGGRSVVSAYGAAGQIGTALCLPACLIALLSGLLLAVGTPWGLLRYYWVTVKFILTTALAVADIAVVDNLLSRAAARAAALPAGAAPAALGVPRLLLAGVTAVQAGVLLAAMLLAIFKPWGRSTYRPARPRPRPRPTPEGTGVTGDAEIAREIGGQRVNPAKKFMFMMAYSGHCLAWFSVPLHDADDWLR
jgi:hypothetical protein